MRPGPLAVVAITAVLALAACSDGGSASRSDPSPASTSAFTDPGATALTTVPPGGRLETAERSSDFAIGQCYNADGFLAGQPVEPTQLHAIGCDAAHRHEVYAVLEDPSSSKASYPGDDAIGAFADDQCLAQFSDYVGTAYERSTLDITDIRPTERSWKVGDRTVVCLLYDQDFADLTGSVKGTRR